MIIYSEPLKSLGKKRKTQKTREPSKQKKEIPPKKSLRGKKIRVEQGTLLTQRYFQTLRIFNWTNSVSTV